MFKFFKGKEKIKINAYNKPIEYKILHIKNGIIRSFHTSNHVPTSVDFENEEISYSLTNAHFLQKVYDIWSKGYDVVEFSCDIEVGNLICDVVTWKGFISNIL